MRLAVMGAATIDKYVLLEHFPDSDSLVFARNHYDFIGGCGANIALNLSANNEVDFYFGSGNDLTATRILDRLIESGLNLNYTAEDGPGALSIVLIDARGERRIVSLGGKALFRGELQEAKYEAVCISESYEDIAVETFERFDGSLRVYVPGGCGFYFGTETVARISDYADFVMLSRPESTMLGKEIEGIRSNVITTRGSDDTVLRDGRGNTYYFAVPLVREKVIDTTGAGDAFCAGFVEEYLKTGNIEKSIRRGHEIASTIITNIGPNLVELRRSNLEEFDG